jgi:hypothetical protein
MTVWSTVRLVDISCSGVLLASSRPIGVSERALLRATFDNKPFNSTVEVRRVQVEGHEDDAGSFRLAVHFLDLDDGSRRALEQFLRKAIV